MSGRGGTCERAGVCLLAFWAGLSGGDGLTLVCEREEMEAGQAEHEEGKAGRADWLLGLGPVRVFYFFSFSISYFKPN